MRLAYYLTRDREVALDLSQEAFVRALNSLPQMLGDQSGGRVWFNRIVVNLCRDWIRRRGIERKALSQLPKDEKVADPVHQAEHQEELTRTRQALLGLPFEYREALTLVGVERLAPKEAAEALRIPDATLRWRLHQARKLLRETLEKDGEHDGS